MIREDGSTLADVPQTPIENGHYLALLRGNYIGMHATVVFRRPVLELVGGFDTSLQAAEDYDLYLRIARRYPIARHATLVAEYRQHGSNMGRDSARMLTSVLAVLRKQRIYVKGNPNYKEAYRTGIRYWQRYYGAPLTKEVRAHLEAHQWKQALLNTLVLLRYAPSALIEAGQRLPLHLQGWLGKSFPRRRRRLDPIRFGNLRRLTPFSREFGFDRGQPIDRYYIERFLASHTPDIRGHVLEVGDDFYTRKFGGDRVVRCDVLHVSEGNPNATIVADLTRAGHIPSESFDCIIFTQTLHLIYEVRAALETLHRILKPGGVLLTTVPGVSQISDDEWADSWYWAFTTLSAGRLFGEVFPTEKVWVEAHGNVLAASAFLYGLAVKELRQQELDYHDPHYQLLITVRAVKPGMTC
jgi:SAM-dependent methyltransferase